MSAYVSRYSPLTHRLMLSKTAKLKANGKILAAHFHQQP